MSTTAPRLLTTVGRRTCHQCGAGCLSRDGVCARCGARHVRECLCGTRLPAGASRCPNCGVEYVGSVTRSRRRDRSTRVQRTALWRSAVRGAGVAVAASLMLNIVVSALAQRQSTDGRLPDGFGERLRAAGETIWQACVSFIDMLCALPLGTLLVVAVVGAGCGMACYLAGAGQWPWTQNAKTSQRRHGRRRREHGSERQASCSSR